MSKILTLSLLLLATSSTGCPAPTPVTTITSIIVGCLTTAAQPLAQAQQDLKAKQNAGATWTALELDVEQAASEAYECAFIESAEDLLTNTQPPPILTLSQEVRTAVEKLRTFLSGQNGGKSVGFKTSQGVL